MNSKITSIYFKFVTFLLAVAVMNFSLEDKRFSKKHIILLTFTTISFILHNLMTIYIKVLKSVSDISARYSCFTSVVYILGTGILYLCLTRQISELFVTMRRTETVLQGLNFTHDQHPTRKRMLALLNLSMLALTISTAIMSLSLHEYEYVMKILQPGLSLTTVILSATEILCQSISGYYIVIAYLAILCPMIEIEISACVFGLLFERQKLAWNQSVVLPVVSRGGTSEFYFSNWVFNDPWVLKKSATKSRSRLIVKLSSWKRFLGVFGEVKRFHFLIAKMCLKHYSFQSCLNILAFPVVLVYHDDATEIRPETLICEVFTGVLIMLPVVLNTFVVYGHNYIVNKMKKEIFDYDDSKARTFLKRFILLAKDPYSQSHNNFFDVDFDLVSRMIDLIALITTSLFVP